MNELFKGFEQLLELAKTLEEKAERGELKTEFQINSRAFSSIPRQTRPSPAAGPPFTVKRGGASAATGPSAPNPASSAAEPVPIMTPPPVSASPNQPAPALGLSLQDVGGLAPVLAELKELVALPLKRPDLLQQLGLEPPRGVLLVGPPGTGKTLTARALAQDLGVNYIAIAGPEVMGKYYGEAEARLRSLFEQAARSAPCLIFIDEVDSLAPDRSKVEGEVEKRLVAQLLSLMDGFAQTQGVVVLAATNRPDHIDPALRRPGRFDREVQFRVPDRDGRLEILRILTRTMPLETTVDLLAIADLAVGFVGADLKALCQKAAYATLRRSVPSLEAPSPATLAVTQADFLAALREVKPSVLRSVSVETPDVPWEEIGGLETIKQTLRESVEGALLYPELYQQTKAKAPRGILLWGPPGTGKTLLAKAVASQARANFIAVNGPELLSCWVGASEQAVREIFARARHAAPCVVFIDEIDTLAPARGRYSGDSGVSDRVVGQLLTELDGVQPQSQIVVIGATNRPDSLDPALLRAGRLELQLKVDLPDREGRLAILQVHNSDRPLDGISLADWADQTAGWNGADLAHLSNQAALAAIRRYRSQGQTDPTLIQITTQDFQQAFMSISQQRSP
ncbi:AAA family ATPase [Trichothermofontia sichuanensis B231]|uniref:AAA family ATPase n=1 Tax=Trichothermofontia sichuanensis TaxID=3045816 RepID=UPI00224770F5|nr:AAA family ATPase [Trichothermofontia sichuanensis]UZQ53419.1 AAA family ATPase [Trichothermofontia sichuanensis B231]